MRVKSCLGQGSGFYDPARKEENSGRTKNRLDLCEEHLKDPMAALAKVLECLENLHWGWYLVSQFVVAASLAQRFCKKCGKGPIGKASGLSWTHGMLWVRTAQRLERSGDLGWRFGPTWSRWTVCVYAWSGMCQGSTGSTGTLFFLIQTDPFAFTKAVAF